MWKMSNFLWKTFDQKNHTIWTFAEISIHFWVKTVTEMTSPHQKVRAPSGNFWNSGAKWELMICYAATANRLLFLYQMHINMDTRTICMKHTAYVSIRLTFNSWLTQVPDRDTSKILNTMFPCKNSYSDDLKAYCWEGLALTSSSFMRHI